MENIFEREHHPLATTPPPMPISLSTFDDQQIKGFIFRWFKSEQHIAQDFWELVQTNIVAVKKIAKTFLVLTFICLVYDKSLRLICNRSLLYRHGLRYFLEDWAMENDTINPDLESLLLETIAYQNFIEQSLIFPKVKVIEQIEFFLSDLNRPKHTTGEILFDVIASQQNLLVKKEADIYSFDHSLLQFYLTAQYIVSHHLIERNADIVRNNLTDLSWASVFILVAGLTSDADKLLLLMEEGSQNYPPQSRNYSDIKCLIVQCKEAAIRLSPETWEGICSRMSLS